MRLRVRHPNGTITLDALNPDQMVFTLRQAIAQALDSPVQNVQGESWHARDAPIGG